MLVGNNNLIEISELGTSAYEITPEETVKKKIKFLLETNKGEFPVQLDYGADLRAFAFNPVDIRMEGALKSYVELILAQWLPYVIIKELSEITSGEGNLGFRLTYELAEGYIDSIDIKI